ncbi:hypothetical protein QKE52_09325 [Corynebacterium sp. c25Ua_47]|uniref:hypothetical protein n=1 Tax=Corynebacterium sp. c25Ua_47 TaxID=3032353 RepID=UPI003263E8C4
MKISRSLAAVALSGTLLLGGTTVAFAEYDGIPLSNTLVYNGVTYYKNSDGNFVPAPGSKDESGEEVKDIISGKDMETHVKNGEAKAPGSDEKGSGSATSSSEAEAPETGKTSASESTEPKESDTSKPSASESTEPKESETSETTEPSESPTSSSETSTSATSSESAEPTPTKTAEPGDKKSSAEGVLSSKDGKPTPLAIFGIVAGVLAAVAAAFPAIAKALNLNIKLPF